jgi:hypothetical protein
MRDNIDTDYLILVTSDGRKNAYNICKERISENLWPIYKGTPQLLNLDKNKKVLFYIAGRDEFSQHFIGSATIDRIIDDIHSNSDPNQEFRQVICYIKFKELKFFKKPLNIKDHIKNLSFIEEKKRNIYGLYFQGGICKINKQSFDYITQNF